MIPPKDSAAMAEKLLSVAQSAQIPTDKPGAMRSLLFEAADLLASQARDLAQLTEKNDQQRRHIEKLSDEVEALTYSLEKRTAEWEEAVDRVANLEESKS